MEVERVQAIATLSKFMETIPAEYVRSENEQPAITTVQGKVLEVPVINLLGGNTDNDRGVIAAVAAAAGEWGLFQVVNHGIPDEVIANLQKVGREFFELPAAEKEVYAKPVDAESIEGYGTRLQKEVGGKKGWVDHLFHKVWPPSAINYKFWPKNPPSYRYITFLPSFACSRHLIRALFLHHVVMSATLLLMEKENLRRLLEREKKHVAGPY